MHESQAWYQAACKHWMGLKDTDYSMNNLNSKVVRKSREIIRNDSHYLGILGLFISELGLSLGSLLIYHV